MKARPSQAGFSLVELLVAMVIGLLITLGALTLINSLFKTYNQVDELARQQERITFTVESMIRGLRNGQNWKMDSDGEPQFCNAAGTDDELSCIYTGNRRLQLHFEEDGVDPETYVFYIGSTESGYSLMEKLVDEPDSGGAVVVDRLQENGFLVCQGNAETSYLFRMHFCPAGATCAASGNASPSCTTDETADDWQGWLRFNAVSRSLAIKKMLGE